MWCDAGLLLLYFGLHAHGITTKYLIQEKINKTETLQIIASRSNTIFTQWPYLRFNRNFGLFFTIEITYGLLNCFGNQINHEGGSHYSLMAKSIISSIIPIKRYIRSDSTKKYQHFHPHYYLAINYICTYLSYIEIDSEKRKRSSFF